MLQRSYSVVRIHLIQFTNVYAQINKSIMKHKNLYCFYSWCWRGLSIRPITYNSTCIEHPFVKCYYYDIMRTNVLICRIHNVPRRTLQMHHVEQELLTLQEYLSSHPIFREVRVSLSLVFCLVLCRSLFVLLSFFIWKLYYLFFFNLRLLITPLVSSTFSCLSSPIRILRYIYFVVNLFRFIWC